LRGDERCGRRVVCPEVSAVTESVAGNKITGRPETEAKKRGYIRMKRRLWCLLLAGAVAVSGLAVTDAAYAEPAKAENGTEDACTEPVQLEETGEEGVVSPSDGEKKQYIVTMAEDARRPEIEVARTVAGEPAGGVSAREAEQILKEAVPEGTIEENTDALEKNDMLLLELEAAEVQELEQSDAVEAVEEDVDMTAAMLPDGSLSLEGEYGSPFLQMEDTEEYDPLFLQTEDVEEWNREMVGLEEPGDGAEGANDTGMRVAVLDSGVNLVADVQVAESVNLVDDEQGMEGFFMDGTGHGTAVAGIIGACDDGYGITGIDPSAQILSIRILDCENRCSLSRLIAGIQKAEEMDADIICMSLGTPRRSVALEKAVLMAQEKGILLIAAAGNGGTVEYPAAYGAVVSVGAVDHEGGLATESSGKEETDLLAPGEDVAATDTFFGADYLSGTSMAAPHVAGMASLLWKKDRSMPAGFIRELLELSAAPAREGEAGVIDYAYALSIYGECRQQYHPGGQTEGSPLQNTQPADTVDLDEDAVEARWGPKHHMDFVVLSMGVEDEKVKDKIFNGESEECEERRKALLTGAVLPDRAFRQDGRNDDKTPYYIHGDKKNFLAFYRFLCHAARAVYNRKDKPAEVKAVMGDLKKYYPKRSDGSAFPSSAKASVTGTTSKQLDDLARALKEKVYGKWDEYVRYKERADEGNNDVRGQKVKRTGETLSYVMIGMAIHSATDAYAHRAWVKENGEWVSIKTHPNHDNRLEGGVRAKAARIVCNRTLRRFHEGAKDCVAPFVMEGIDGYGGNAEGAFRMLDFQKCADELTDKYKHKLKRYSYTK
jgi:subtilisin family serine protease